ncbi:MAG: DNA repair protein RecN [Gammaproteobacteria bacterium]|nr:DNA repair protein RecN [Gammaproteobacteria bacterium]
MLTQIDISHLATIKDLHLELLPGTTVITGETGAGKSVLIDAIELALGSRATGDMVRAGQDKADVSISFDISRLNEAKAWLKNADMDADSGECIIRRTVHKDGRSRSYINGTPSTLQLLRELSDLLINIHGQHEHQALFKQDTQREMLDKYAGHLDSVTKVASLAKEWHTLAHTISTLKKSNDERSSRGDFLRFQLRELEELQLSADEFQTLEIEHKQLANSGELLQNVNLALHHLAEEENHNALSLLNHALDALESVQAFDPKITSWIENLKSVTIQLSDSESELRHYLENVDLDPDRLQWVEQRIGTLFDTARKHKVAPSELFDLQQRIATELAALDTSDERIAELELQLQDIEKNYLIAATKLSDSRKKSAKKLTQEITQIIHELSLPHGQFHVHFATDDVPRFAPFGLEKIVFHITTNLGQPLQPLAKVASGGELSRISLAIHMATAEQHTIPSLIFDEVDVGISGGTAEIVGKLLRRLGNTHQLLCITHLPQVAAQGEQHLLVEKRHEQNETYTQIRMLNTKEKINELARMLGGVEITKKTIEHAREMLEKV